MRKAEKIAAVALLGGLVSRWHGGGFFDTKKIVINTLWALPFAFAVYVAHHGSALAWALAALVFVCTAALKATGHGGGMDLGYSPKEPGAGRDPEKLEWFLIWAHDDLPRYWYDVILMTWIGLAGALPAAVAIGFLHPLAGVLIAFGGLMKGPAYMIGWRVFPNEKGKGPKEFDEATELGEFLSGLFQYLFLALGFIAMGA